MDPEFKAGDRVRVKLSVPGATGNVYEFLRVEERSPADCWVLNHEAEREWYLSVADLEHTRLPLTKRKVAS